MSVIDHSLHFFMFTDFVDHYNGRYYVGVSAFVKVVLKVIQSIIISV